MKRKLVKLLSLTEGITIVMIVISLIFMITKFNTNKQTWEFFLSTCLFISNGLWAIITIMAATINKKE